MGLSHQQLVHLAHRMIMRASLMASIAKPGIGEEDVDALRHWRNVIAEEVSPHCVAVRELDTAIGAAEEAVELEEGARAEVTVVTIAIMIAAAAGALLEAVRNAGIELSNN